MKKKSLNQKSIAIKLSIYMLVIIFAQSVFLVGSILASGVLSGLKENVYTAFTEKISNRKNYLETEMNTRWSNLSNYSAQIENLYSSIPNKGAILTPEQADAFLMDSAPTLISMLRSTMTCGAFIILDDNQSPQSAHSGFYVKDYDPALNNEFNRDLYISKGPVEISRALQIPLDNAWSYGITLCEDNFDLYQKPYDAALAQKDKLKNGDIRLLGYWNQANNTAQNILTYSLPLVDANNNVFGVIGVEISEDYLYKILPATELDTNFPLGYILAQRSKTSGEIMPLITTGTLQSSLIDKSVPLELSAVRGKASVQKISNHLQDFEILCSAQPIKLYNHNTPFEDEEWLLIGMANQNSLLAFVHKITLTLVLAFLISILTGSWIVYLVGFRFARPIVEIAQKVRSNSAQNAVCLPRTGLTEIDDLSIAIESLNRNVLDSVLKMDTIIGMVNMPIGAFDYKNGSPFVTVTPRLFDVLNLPAPADDTTISDSSSFFKMLENVRTFPEEEEEDVYAIEGNPKKWVQLKSVTNDSGTLGIVMDVTKDILKKHLIKFERDYDALTKIYNRSAFHRETMRIFEQGNLKTAAFVMFDLDNLKYINDTYGHDLGDIYIKTAANLLSEFPSAASVVARMSGDEFYVFFHGFGSKEEIRDLMNGLYQRLDNYSIALPNGNKFKVRISSGLAWYGDDSLSYEELVRFADFAMYEGKHSVKGEMREFNKKIYESESFMFSGKEELNKVLDNQLIDYAFQPIVSAKTGKIYGYESLMRPQSEVLNSPLKLIQIASAQSSLWKVERITFFKTLSSYAKYQHLFDGCKVFINSVPNQLLKDEEYAELARVYPQILPHLVVEMIENEKLNDETFEKKRALIESWGATIALDDYGSGYNSDVSMLSIRPSIVKIDRFITDEIASDPNRQAIIQKLITYSSARGILVLAEGIEHREQMEFLIGMGVDLLQGYYIGMPSFMPQPISKTVVKQIGAAQGQMIAPPLLK